MCRSVAVGLRTALISSVHRLETQMKVFLKYFMHASIILHNGVVCYLIPLLQRRCAAGTPFTVELHKKDLAVVAQSAIIPTRRYAAWEPSNQLSQDSSVALAHHTIPR